MDLTYVPPEFVDSLLSSADILNVVSSRIALKKTGINYSACCPFHQEKTASFTVSETKQFYYCFGCGAGGSAVSFIMEYDGLPFVDAVAVLAQETGIDTGHLEKERDSERDEMVVVNNKVAADYHSFLTDDSAGKDYLTKRKISNDTIKKFAIGLSKDGWRDVSNRYKHQKKTLESLRLIRHSGESEYDTFRNRLMFPIRARSGDTIGFGARALGDDKPKYLNSEESLLFKKRDTLYGLFESKLDIRHEGRAIVVEGYMDVVGLSEYGINYAVATMGTAITDRQLSVLSQYSNTILFCLDGDKAGQAAAVRSLATLLPILKDGLNIQYVFLPDGHDPDSFIIEKGKSAFEDLLEKGRQGRTAVGRRSQSRLSAAVTTAGLHRSSGDISASGPGR